MPTTTPASKKANPAIPPAGLAAHATPPDGNAAARRGRDLDAGGDRPRHGGWLKLCLQRMMAPMRGRPIEIDLPAGDGTIASVGERLEATVAAVASGEITPDEAESLARVLQEQRHQIETEDIDRRIMKLEEAARRRDERERTAARKGDRRLLG
jgi:hypothetical protein